MASDPAVYLRSPIKRPLLSNVAVVARVLMSTVPLDSSRLLMNARSPSRSARLRHVWMGAALFGMAPSTWSLLLGVSCPA
eukprot:8605979-Lingulodinium_polyedra.AAC.1